MFKKGDIVRRIGEDELFRVVKTNVPIGHAKNALGRTLFRKSKIHMVIINDSMMYPMTVLKADFEHTCGGKKKITPHSFL